MSLKKQARYILINFFKPIVTFYTKQKKNSILTKKDKIIIKNKEKT